MRLPALPRPALEALIIAFCLWHMTAITLYNIPVKYLGIVGHVRTITDPYVFRFSQWQYWDIFSPEPMRRVPRFIVERNAGDRWETAMIISYADLPWWLRVKEMKVVDRLAGDWKNLTIPYLLALCPELPYTSDREIRLTMRYFFLPSDLSSLKTLARKPFAETSQFLGSTRCPSRK